MTVRCIRPQIQDLRFHFFARPIHPELVTILAKKRIHLGGFLINLCLTDSGHLIQYTRGDDTITEIVSAKETPLPRNKHNLNEVIRGSKHVDCQPSDAIQYHAGLQIETLESELFDRLQAELIVDSQEAALVERIGGEGRMDSEAISFISVENLSDAILISSVHTYPDEHSIVKTQALLECR